jgi:hypothetical protein
VSVPDVEEDSEPKENVKKYMREKVYQLPLPEAMKAYLIMVYFILLKNLITTASFRATFIG